MPRDRAIDDARSQWRRANRKAALRASAGDERGHRVPQGTGKVEDSSEPWAEEAGRFNCSAYLALN